MYVNVHVFGPPHSGSALGTPADGVMVLPQLSVTGGGAGAVASDGQSTVELPASGNVTVGGLIVYVYTQSYVWPSHAVYVNVHVLSPEQGGSAPGTPADGVMVLPQLSVTGGGAGGSKASAGQSTVEPPVGGNVTTGGLIV